MSLDSTQQAAKDQFSARSAHYGKGHILEQVADVEAAYAKLSPAARSGDALDIATGGGHTGIFLASKGHRVTLSDISPSMLEKARTLAASKGFSVETREHAAEALPYSDASFSLVTCRVAPHHFSSPEKFMKEVARVLIPNGQFILIDGSVRDNDPEVEEWLHKVEKLRDPSHARFLSPSSWRALAEKSGLRVDSSELSERLQPDLTWYFEVAGTSAENRASVQHLLNEASDHVREAMKIIEREGLIQWHWVMLTMIATKPTNGVR